KSEVAHARRGEFKRMAGRWVLPAARTKQAAAHVVPISRFLMRILDRTRTMEGTDEDHIFGRPLNAWSRIKKRIDKLTGPVAPWTIHDIRRTCRARLSALKVPDHIAELAIGHARKGLQRTYDLHRFEDELREAFEHWADALE